MSARRAAVVVLVGIGFWVALPGAAAQAHPLGNFTVNHYAHVQLFPDRVEVTAVVDRAEIPAAQALQSIAPDGPPGTDQLATSAAAECADLSAAVHVAVDGLAVDWSVVDSGMEAVPGAAGLPTLRLSCDLRSPAELGAAAEVTFEDTYLPDRVGWREVTADGTGVRLVDSPVPVASISDALRAYPDDLLSSPVDVRSFTVATEPGENTGAGAALTADSGDPFSSALAQLDRWLEDVIGGRELTPLVGTLAVVLALLLGSGHALLPGHGKSVMAAYLAGRRGRARDAFTVGATVTATHTAGVLVFGLALSVSSALAGDQVIRWLGVLSGLLVAAIGVFMLRAALGGRRPVPGHLPTVEPMPEAALVGAGVGHVHGPHGQGHDHGHGHHHDHGQDHHDHGHDHHHDHGPTARGGLIGMGIAGGLVPSPSALIVLLASVGLGRTAFGVVLVLAYGLGMAATLTGVGLLLVRLRGRLDRRLAGARPRRWLTGVMAATPVVTAGLVLLVGLALVTRGVVLGA